MIKKIRLPKAIALAISIFFSVMYTCRAAAPPNDDCGAAIPIVISNAGFGLGVFTAVNTDMTSATLQSGETFAPSIIVAGLNKKSVWYKFSLPTTRAARISLAQPGSGIQAGNVGFAVYKTNNCIPGNPEISTKFSPIEIFGSSYHPCVEAGDYLVQVTSNLNANGPIFITLDLGEPDPAPYDKPVNAYNFTTINTHKVSVVDYLVQCQSIDNAAENCLPNTAFKDYTKSTWQTFTTPSYFDYVSSWVGVYPGNYGTAPMKIGYRIYEGDAASAPLSSLLPIGGCDSIITDMYAVGKKNYYCSDLKPNTTYTIQLLFHKDFINNIRVGIEWNGSKPTNGPLPVSSLATPNKMGTLNADGSLYGVANNVADVFGCNSRHMQNNCPKSMPVTGILYNGLKYNMSSFVSFNLATTSSVYFYATIAACNGILLRLYKQDLTGNCSGLDTANLVATFDGSIYANNPLSCLAAGNYVLQVMGVDSAKQTYIHFPSSLTNSVANYLCSFYNLGNDFNVRINVRTEVAINKFALDAPGKVDKFNTNTGGTMQPLLTNVAYQAKVDTFGCANTVMPDSLECMDNYNQPMTKASYREFVLGDSVMVLVNMHNTWNSKLYQGDADALTTAQNKHNYPDKFTGLKPFSKCLFYYNSGASPYACAIPGTYTMASFDNRLSQPSNLEITAKTTRTKHSTPATAQDMGDLWSYVAPNTWHQSDLDTFTCHDNPATIDGVIPCNSQQGVPSTKLIYRQFYLSKPSGLSIYNYIGFSGEPYGYGVFTLFTGKATDGIGTLKKVGPNWTCFTRAATAGQCDLMPAGWYTVVSYGSGPSYADPLGGMNPGDTYQRSSLGLNDKFMIFISTGCPAPNFNRPYKASVDAVTKKPYLIEWGPQTGHTAAYPLTRKTYTLNRENFDCTIDSVFIKANMVSCQTNYSKVAFYVFEITQSSYVQISNFNGAYASVYDFDVRTADSIKLKTQQPLQKCTDKTGRVDFCQLQPGIYSLILLVPDTWNCSSIAPSIYIDQVGISRFDHASNAYDFGTLLPDSTWRNGKVGDTNPLNTGRAASNDFFYCTTGAQQIDPTDATCYNVYNPNIYPARNNAVLNPESATTSPHPYSDRRNLWYSFVIDHPGTVQIKVENKTLNKTLQNVFAVYKSDVDASIPFNMVKANGLVDSTLLQGLQLVGTNMSASYGYCTGPSYFGNNTVSFNVAPCNFTPTRYYVLVEMRSYHRDPWYSGEDMTPNHQVEVSALLDSINSVPPKFDHYSLANDMGLVNTGIKKGAVDNFTCATRDLPDPLYAYTTCQKTLWYKFTTTTTGQIRYAAFFKNTNNYYYDHIQLFRQIKPNDSSATGLQHMPYTVAYSNNGTWAQQCISPGTYYIILPGCNALNEDVYPQIEIIPQAGDFCSAPMVASLNGAGSKVVPVTIDCHTIGTDYGEFNPTLTCPAGAVTNNYKTSWYRLDITGTDTLDVTVYINEKTNAGSTDIKYRMMTGTCGAMQEQSCVQDALTRNTYKCLAPGNSYYIQVFSPTSINSYTQVTGDIDLNIAAVAHVDTCLPASNCIGVANFTPQFDCTKDKNVIFTNFSTFGSSIKYDWDFGYNNQKSNAVSPAFFYPALTTGKTYTVKLVVTNLLCGKKDSSIQTITIPARPAVDLGKDTIICSNGATLSLNASSHAGATYYWYDGSTQPAITVSGLNYNAWVEVSYGSCKTRDTIAVFVNPVAKRTLQTKALCAVTQVTLDANRGQGELYQWSTGVFSSSIVVSQPGYYWADLYWNGCIVRDSFLVVSSSLKPLGNDTTVCQAQMPYQANAVVSGASSYSWQDGSSNASYSITRPGLYWVDINLSGCSFRDTLIIKVDSFKTATINSRICQGQKYLLPSGKIISTTGTFTDSLKNIRGCDSLITTLTLAVDTVKRVNNSVSICAGQTYLLPSGKIISTAGNFTDTVKNKNGCDSLITQLNLTLTAVTRNSKTASICSGALYSLPSGKTISATGIYMDTIKAKAGCDSLITTVNLSVLSPTINSSLASICAGNSYTLPSGVPVNTGGIYRDTLRYLNGCDSVIRIVTLTVNARPSLGADKLLSTCMGKPVNLGIAYSTSGLVAGWTLNGSIVNNPTTVFAAGQYQLIASNAAGCSDTATVTVSIDATPVLGVDKSMAICFGNPADIASQYNTTGLSSNWSLNGVTVANPAAVYIAGDYRLIVSNNTGCQDTAMVSVTTDPKPALGQDKNIAVCPGSVADLSNLFVTTGLAKTWTIGGTAVNNPAAVGAGTYQLIVSNAAGCLDTALVTVTFSAKPVLGPDQSTSICAGQIKNLTNLFNTIGLTTNWTINGTPVPNPSAISTAGTYRLVVTNTAGCMDTAFVTVAVDPKPNLGIDKTVTVCAGTVVNLTTQYNTTGFTTKWSFNGNPVANPSAIAATGSYLLVVNNLSGCTDTAMINVLSNPKPSLGADQSLSTCIGSNFDLTASFPTSGLNTAWTLGSTVVANPASVGIAGTYQVIVSNGFACSDTATATLTIYQNPALTTTNPPAVCTPATVDITGANITAGSAPGLAYTYWSNIAATVPVANPRAVTSGVYYVKATDAKNCTNIQPVTVLVYDLPIVNAGNDTVICDQGFVTLRGSSGNLSGGTVSYLWTPAAGLASPATVSTFARPGATTTYTLTAKIIYSTCTLTVSDNVKVTMQPPVQASAGNDTIAVAGVPHQLKATGGASYVWSPSALLNNAFIANPLANLLADTRFTVRVTDVAGCVASATVLVKVYAGITYYVPNAFSPNGDGLNDVFRAISAGIASTEYFRIFSRYGETVFETNQPMKGWDGTFKGIPQPMGNYVWAIKGIGRNGKVVEMSGNVVLIR